MTNFAHFFSLCSLLCLSCVAGAADNCPAVNCDCSSLPTESWQNSCASHEAQLKTDCAANFNQPNGFCALHGPAAFPVPLAVKVSAATPVSMAEANKLNGDAALMYWSALNDFEAMNKLVDGENYGDAKSKLRTMNVVYDNLFSAQQKIAASLADKKQLADAQMSWRNFSQQTLVAAVDLYNYGEYLLNTYDDVADNKMRGERLELGLQVMTLAGKVYEQVGLAYENGVRNKHAAEAWKYAAEASSLALAHTASESAASTEVNHLRMQSAARLHRASYNWGLGIGLGSDEVQQSLAEAQKFMEDGASLGALVEEQRQINASRPYWQK